MKTLLILSISGLFFAGCASTAPDSDPVVVRAEQTVQMTFTVLDSFLEWEHTYRDQLPLPLDLTAFADKVRREAPRAIRTARAATKSYKVNRTPENKATLETALAVLETLMRQAQYYLNKPQAALEPSPMLAVSPAVIVAAIGALMQLLQMVQQLRAEAVRNKEWTPEEERDIDNKLAEAFNSEHWKL